MIRRGHTHIPALLVLLIALCLPSLAAPTGLSLTPAEQQWLRDHPRVRIAPAPDFPPFEFFDDQGHFSGITADYLRIMQQRLGIRFDVQRLPTWEAVVEKSRGGEIDLWGAATATPERADYMVFTRPYLNFPAAIIVRRGTYPRLTLEQLAGLKVVSISRYVTDDYLAREHPKVERIVVPDAETGLKMVSFGVADAIVLNAAQASHYIQKIGLTNLEVAGESRVRWALSFAVRRDAPELASMIQKVLDSLTPAEREAILRKWVSLDGAASDRLRKYLLLIGAAAGAILLAGAVVCAMNFSLRRAVRQRTEELSRSRADLEAQTESLLAINEISDSIYRSLDLETVADRATEALMRRSRSVSVAIYLLSPDLTLLELLHSKGFSQEVIPTVRILPVSGSLSGVAVRERQVVAATHIDTDPRIDPGARAYLLGLGYRSAVCVPLLAEDRVLGVYNLLDREQRILTRLEEDELIIIGKTVGLAISNALNVRHLHQEMAERRHAEEELRNAHDSLERKVAERTRELAEANERLKELDHLKSMFIASMSHELRTPLNSIIGFTGIILQGMSGELTPRQKDQLGRVYRSARHLLNLIIDVIDISKIEAGKVEAYPETLHLAEVVREAAEEVQQQFPEKDLALLVSVPDDLVLSTDRKRLLQCLLNFLSNAFKYTEAGSVRLSARTDGEQVEIEVADTGIGISPADLDRLFNPFVRLESALRTTVPGTGLGLYLTGKLVCEVLQGTVRAESRVGEGSCFRMCLPRDLDQVPTSVGVPAADGGATGCSVP